MKIIICILFIFFVFSFTQINANPIATDPGSSTFNIQDAALRVYIDYQRSDNLERYLRSEIPFVSYVRDPFLAQIHIFITDQETGSGGSRFNISFIGKEEFEGHNQDLFFISPQSDTDDLRREGIAKMLKMGLMPYVAMTSEADQIDISYRVEKKASFQEKIIDPWNFWVFSIDIGGSIQAEESRDSYYIISQFDADRITEDWKLRNRLFHIYEEQNFIDDGESFSSVLKEWNFRSSPVYSLSKRWSAGLFAEIYSTTYRNVKLGWRLAPALEYNFFPWPEAERRKFTISYRAGYSSYKYYEVTLFDKIEQDLWFHSLAGELEMTQPWGNLDFEVESFQYPELKDTYSVKVDIELSFRISSGLELVLDSRLESIHDQIYLPKGDASIDEILLRRRQLATTYDVRFGIGFRYTFGSIYNNIINERM
jgi:hypothetical protein